MKLEELKNTINNLTRRLKHQSIIIYQKVRFFFQYLIRIVWYFILWIFKNIQTFLDCILRFWKRLPFYKQEFNDFAKSGKSWPLYLLLVILSFILCNFRLQNILSEQINFNFYRLLNLRIDSELAFKLIDSSLGVIATIFSIAFIIIGFLISNLKKYQEDTYDMIYRNIKLFPTLYLSLTVIGILVILSLFRGSFNSITFINIVVWGTALIILTLFMIGSLFRKVIEHIKPKNVYRYYFFEIKRIAERVRHNFKVEKNRTRLDEMKVSLEERLIFASAHGDTENLKHILFVYEEISKLDI